MRAFPAAILILAFAAPLKAQRAEASVFVGLSQVLDNSLGELLDGESVRLENGFRAGARVGVNAGPFTGHELSYAFERHDLKVYGAQQTVARVHQLYYNFLLHLTPQKVAVRPFVTAGGGVSRFSTEAGGAFDEERTKAKAGVNFGGGLKLRMGKAVGARFDVRDYLTGKPMLTRLAGLSGRLHRVEYSAGLSLLF